MGKTAVFVLTILHNLMDDPKPCSALILCHTRELAYQIRNELKRFSKYMQSVRSEVIYGGEPYDTHVKLLAGPNSPHIIVGTPGRILALARDKHLPLDNLKMFVLDECDKLLDQVSKFIRILTLLLSMTGKIFVLFYCIYVKFPHFFLPCLLIYFLLYRHALWHSEDFPWDSPQQIGYDVHCYSFWANQGHLPQVHAPAHRGPHWKRQQVNLARS